MQRRRRDPSRATDLHTQQYMGPHQVIHPRSTNAQQLGGFLRRQKQLFRDQLRPSACTLALCVIWSMSQSSASARPPVHVTAREHAPRSAAAICGLRMRASHLIQSVLQAFSVSTTEPVENLPLRDESIGTIPK